MVQRVQASCNANGEIKNSTPAVPIRNRDSERLSLARVDQVLRRSGLGTPGDDKYPGGAPYTMGGVHGHNPLWGIASCAGFGGNRYDTGPGSLMNPPQLWQ